MTLNVPNKYKNKQLGTAAIFNDNYDYIVDYINDRNQGLSSWESVTVENGTNVPVIVDNLTGTSSIFEFRDNGNTVSQLYDGGIYSAPYQSYFIGKKNGDQSLDPTQTYGGTARWEISDSINLSYSGATRSITILKSGIYLFQAYVQVETKNVGGVGMTLNGVELFKNGNLYIGTAALDFTTGTPRSTYYFCISNILSCTENDYFDIRIKDIYGLVSGDRFELLLGSVFRVIKLL